MRCRDHLGAAARFGALALSSLAPVHAAQTEQVARVAELLERVEGERADAGVAREIARLGAEGLAGILAFVASSGLDRLEPGRRATLDQAVGLASRPVARDFLGAALAQQGPPERDAAALWMYGALEDPTSLAPMARLANRAPAENGPLFRQSVARVLIQEPGSCPTIAGVARIAEDPLLPHLALAVGDSGERAGLLALVSLLHRTGECDLAVLQQVARIAAALPAPFDEEVGASLRPLLASVAGDALVACVAALGALEDADSARVLTEHLESPDPRLSATALGALQRIGRQRFPARRALWEVWLEDEERWWSEEAPTLLADLAAGGLAEAARRLRLLSQHALHRHAVAAEVCALLEHEDGRLRALACVTLGQLGSALAVEPLRSAARIEDSAPAARAALESLANRSAPD
jgi:hypothetical protein